MEAELAAAARAGDKEAFGRLLERHQPLVLGIATRMVRHAETAQELAQEAMLEAYLSLHTLRRPERFQSWLYGITLNVCRSSLRDRSINYLSLEAMAGGLAFDALPFTGGRLDPQEIVEARELHALVLEAVNSLSPKNREATLLFYYDQLSVREIAALLGISPAAVKGRLHKSRQQLKERLTALAVEPGMISTKEREDAMVKVTVADVVRQDQAPGYFAGLYVVILLEEGGQRLLPIWIGPFEGNVIALHLLEQAMPRPFTHALMANLLDAVGATVEEVRIEALREITYYAVVKLRTGDTVQEVDARPSDAIALALHKGRPIYVADEVMERAGVTVPEAYQKAPAHKGLEEIATKLEEQKKEQERKLQEAKEAASQREGVEQARQELFAFLFGEQG